MRNCRNQIGNFSENCDSVAKNSKLVPECDGFENVLLWLENSICFLFLIVICTMLDQRKPLSTSNGFGVQLLETIKYI